MDIIDKLGNEPSLQVPSKFSSGQDSWYFEDSHAKRQELIDAARRGSMHAIDALKSHPYYLSELMLNGVQIF